jgi:2-polyprenyl-6-methoxyphenol hydroxylase-like FAD-dependent oxidoreductase
VESPSVVVVGAGPTGLATACGLRLRGVSIRLFDRAAGPAATSRALGLQPRGAEVLDRLGALGDLVDRARPIGQVVVHVGGRELARLAVGRPTRLVQRPGLIVSQVEIERVLRERLAGLGGTVEWGRAVTDLRRVADAVDVALADGEIIRARWVVGCDGAHSRVRAAAGIEFPGVPRSERFLLADVRAELGWSRESVAVWLHGRDLVAAFPLPGPAAWRLMGTAPDATDVAPDAVLDVLVDRFGLHTGTRPVVRACDWTSTFQIHRRLASSYRRDRVLLAGDAAHIHSPLGGQGMNTGIGDAENLAWKLAMVVRGRAGDVLLDTYSAERRPVAEEVLASTGSLTGLMLGGSLPARLVRDHALVPLFNAAVVQRLLWEQASQLKLSYRDGPLGDRAWCPWPRSGDRVRDIAGAREDGRPTRLHAELGARWVVVAPATRRGAACTAAARRWLGSDDLTRIMPAQPAHRVSLVRPDAHLAWSGRDPAALARRLARVLWDAAGPTRAAGS